MKYLSNLCVEKAAQGMTNLTVLCQLVIDNCLTTTPGLSPGGAGGAWAPLPVFGQTVNPISTMGQIIPTIVLRAPPDFETLWQLLTAKAKSCSTIINCSSKINEPNHVVTIRRLLIAWNCEWHYCSFLLCMIFRNPKKVWNAKTYTKVCFL